MRNAIRVRRLVDGRLYEREVRPGGWLTSDECTRFLDVSRRQLFYLIERGSLHPRKIRGRLRFAAAEAVQLVKPREGGRHRHGQQAAT